MTDFGKNPIFTALKKTNILQEPKAKIVGHKRKLKEKR